MEQQTAVIIVAAGNGNRMGSTLPKQFMFLSGVPLLGRTINNFAAALQGAEIVVVLPEAYTEYWKNLSARFDIASHTIAKGGAERFNSVRSGIEALKTSPHLIAVQDGVRPLCSSALIRRTVAAAAEHGTAIPVIEPVDSFRETDGVKSHIIDRKRLRIVQTPQVFRSELLRSAYKTEFRPDFTDDASVVEHSGVEVFLCTGERTNIKITTPEDLIIAEAILKNSGESL